MPDATRRRGSPSIPARLSRREELRGEALDIEWDADCRLSIHDTRWEGTRVAGGMLVEAAPLGGERKAKSARFVSPHAGLVETLEDGAYEPALHRRMVAEDLPLATDCTIHLTDEPGVIRIDATLRNTGLEPLRMQRVFPFVGGAWWENGSLAVADQSAHLAAYKNGWQSWSFVGGLPSDKPDPVQRLPTSVAWHLPGGRAITNPAGQQVDVTSEGVALLGRSDAPVALLAGFLDGNEWVGQIYLQRREGALAACVLLDDRVLNPGEALALPPLVLGFGPRDDLLPAYAAMLAQEVPDLRETPRDAATATSPTGWCSWYYYFTKVTRDDISENLAALQRLRDLTPLGVVQIDDGYPSAIGDWTEPNEQFPGGLAPLAARIREAGFRPGLWLAPFTVAANSKLAHEHPDWMVHDVADKPVFGGKNWNSLLYGLDTSHPDARDWLRDLFTTITRDWGFDYLKLDFLVSGALLGRRYDPHITRMAALRDGLALIREIVGDDVYLLACGCPLLSAVGIVDAMRIGPDVTPNWQSRGQGLPTPAPDSVVMPGTLGALRNTLMRAWMQPALWTNDPDCLLLRETESQLTLDEVRAFASAVALTGGMVLASDRLARLPLDRLDLLSKLLPPLPERGLPTDPFAYGIPERVVTPIRRAWGERTLVGLFNQEKREREMTCTWDEARLAPGAYHAVEFWSGAYLGRSDEGAHVRVPGHGAAVLALTPDAGDEPLLLSTSFHVGQGAAEVRDWRFDRARCEVRWQAQLGRHAVGTFMLWLPEPWRIRSLSSTARAATWRGGPNGETLIEAEIRDEAAFVLELEQTAQVEQIERIERMEQVERGELGE